MRKKRVTKRMADVIAGASLRGTSVRAPRPLRMRDFVEANSSAPHQNVSKHLSTSEATISDVIYTSTVDSTETHRTPSSCEYDNSNGGPTVYNIGGLASSKKRGRGIAKSWKDWGKEVKNIQWDELNQPTGENACKLMNHLGTYARNGELFPLDFVSWKGMSEVTQEKVWNDIKINTNAPDGFKEHCLKKIGLFWKSFKNRLKKEYYEVYDLDEDRLAHIPPNVVPEQWTELVRYWGSTTAKSVAARNSTNRQGVCAYPRTGRVSFACVKEKLKKQDKPTDLLSMWRATRAKNGTFNEDDGAAAIEASIKKKMKALPKEERNDIGKRDKIFRDVVGQDGHGGVLCMGSIKPTCEPQSPLSNSNYESELNRLREELHEHDRHHNNQMNELKAKIAEQESRFLSMMQNAALLVQSMNTIPTSENSSANSAT